MILQLHLFLGKKVHPKGYNPFYINSPTFPSITSPISAETDNNGVIANIYLIDCKAPKTDKRRLPHSRWSHSQSPTYSLTIVLYELSCVNLSNKIL